MGNAASSIGTKLGVTYCGTKNRGSGKFLTQIVSWLSTVDTEFVLVRVLATLSTSRVLVKYANLKTSFNGVTPIGAYGTYLTNTVGLNGDGFRFLLSLLSFFVHCCTELGVADQY